MKKEVWIAIIFSAVFLGLGFVLASLHHQKLEKYEKFKSDSIRLEIKAERARSLEANACYFCKNQIGDKSYTIENDGTFKELLKKNGDRGMFCSIKCCKAFLVKDEEDYNRRHSNSSTSDTPESNDGSETWIPTGYHKGGSCYDCSGTGHYTYSIEGTGVNEGGVCAGCNGRGYNLIKN